MRMLALLMFCFWQDKDSWFLLKVFWTRAARFYGNVIGMLSLTTVMEIFFMISPFCFFPPSSQWPQHSLWYSASHPLKILIKCGPWGEERSNHQTKYITVMQNLHNRIVCLGRICFWKELSTCYRGPLLGMQRPPLFCVIDATHMPGNCKIKTTRPHLKPHYSYW